MLRLEEVIKRLEEEYPDSIMSLGAATPTDVLIRRTQLEMIAFIKLIGDTSHIKKKDK